MFGMGAYLMDESQIVSWYAVALTKNDEQWLGIKVGDETFQQVAESLNLVVALRVWKHHWQSERIKLEVRSDKVAAQHLVLRLKGKSPGMNQVARELALDLGDAAFRPDIVTHTLGVASEIADALSRKANTNQVLKFGCLLAYRAFQMLFRPRGPEIGGRQLQSAEACWTGRAEYKLWFTFHSGTHCLLDELCVWHVFALSGLFGSVLLFIFRQVCFFFWEAGPLSFLEAFSAVFDCSYHGDEPVWGRVCGLTGLLSSVLLFMTWQGVGASLRTCWSSQQCSDVQFSVPSGVPLNFVFEFTILRVCRVDLQLLADVLFEGVSTDGQSSHSLRGVSSYLLWNVYLCALTARCFTAIGPGECRRRRLTAILVGCVTESFAHRFGFLV